jgi:hypothetical protein
MRILALAVSGLIGASTLAFAQGLGQPSTDSFKASSLYMACTHSASGTPDADDKIIDITCEAFLRGLADGLFFMQAAARKGMHTCMPEESPVSQAEARRLFVSWVNAHPDQMVNGAGVVAAVSILTAHKCAK